MTHSFTKIKSGLSHTVGLWEKEHRYGTKTQVVIEDQTDNVPDDSAAYVVFALHLEGDGSQERLDESVIGNAHDDTEAVDMAKEWMGKHPGGLSPFSE